MPELTSAFNLASGKPGVRFYEGRLGVRRVLDDSLNSRDVVLAYSDVSVIQKEIGDVNSDFSKKRIIKQKHKKFLMPDTEKNRKLMSESNDAIKKLTEVKFMNMSIDKSFKTMMHIYDNKVSFITFEEDGMIGVIIEDKFVYQMSKILFQYMWSIH